MPRTTQTAAGRWSLTWHTGPAATPLECRAELAGRGLAPGSCLNSMWPVRTPQGGSATA